MNAQQPFEYTWKIGVEYWSRRSLRTNRALTENTTLIDLFDGHRYAVQMIFPAGTKDREFEIMPETAIQTWPAGSLSEDELATLRARANYVPDEYCGPHADVVFF
jgi:hypothetical protein